MAELKIKAHSIKVKYIKSISKHQNLNRHYISQGLM